MRAFEGPSWSAGGILLIAIIVGVPTGCAGGSDPDLAVRRDLAGDTVVLTIAGVPDTVVANGVTVVWRSERLERPTVMARVGDRLVVGDRVQVHVVSLSGDGSPVTMGREGEGPGELRAVGAVGALAGDTIAVWDHRLHRLSLWSPAGDLLDMRRLATDDRFAGGLRNDPLRTYAGGILAVLNERVIGPRRDSVALVAMDPAGQAVRVLEVWPGAERQMIDGGRMLASTSLFATGVIAAVGRDGLVARGTGQDYCVTVFRAESGDPPLRICRDRERTPTGAGIRSPDWSSIEDPGQRGVFRTLHENMEVPDRLPSFDRLVLGDDGSLWARTLGPEMAGVHPFLEVTDVADGPEHRDWDVFDADGSLLRTVRLPATLDPQVVTLDRVYGFYELPTGELAVAAAEVGR